MLYTIIILIRNIIVIIFSYYRLFTRTSFMLGHWKSVINRSLPAPRTNNWGSTESSQQSRNKSTILTKRFLQQIVCWTQQLRVCLSGLKQRTVAVFVAVGFNPGDLPQLQYMGLSAGGNSTQIILGTLYSNCPLVGFIVAYVKMGGTDTVCLKRLPGLVIDASISRGQAE